MRQDALETLKVKRTKQDEHGPPDKKGKFNLEKIWQQKQKLKESELMLREKELEFGLALRGKSEASGRSPEAKCRPDEPNAGTYATRDAANDN